MQFCEIKSRFSVSLSGRWANESHFSLHRQCQNWNLFQAQHCTGRRNWFAVKRIHRENFLFHSKNRQRDLTWPHASLRLRWNRMAAVVVVGRRKANPTHTKKADSCAACFGRIPDSQPFPFLCYLSSLRPLFSPPNFFSDSTDGAKWRGGFHLFWPDRASVNQQPDDQCPFLSEMKTDIRRI